MPIIPAPSPHKNRRPPGEVISAIVLHDSVSATVQGVLSWFHNPSSHVSAHYVIDYDGQTYQCVPDEERAWHAGTSELWGQVDVNDFSIGIELVNTGDESYPDPQVMALVDLCASLAYKHWVPLHRVVGHRHVAVPIGRKSDPNDHFPWFEFLAAVGAHCAERLDG